MDLNRIFIKNCGQTTLSIYTLGIELDMGYIYGAFILFVLIASSNAVNLTDGLDGLAGGLSVMAFLAFALISYGSTWVSGYADIAIFSFILVGSLMGFLLYNTYPAKIFMGDSGSLALGGLFASIAIIEDLTIALFVIGGVFVCEMFCVCLQQVSVRLFHKRVFSYTPIHYAFVIKGHKETSVVIGFYIAAAISGIIGVIIGLI